MNIIQKKWEFLNATTPYVPKQASKLYRFGLAVLVARSIGSLRSNARLAALNWNTAKSKAYRITRNERMVEAFHALVPVLAPISSDDAVCVDFSDFGNGFQVLTFAKQTYRGRALPLYCEVLRYPIPKDSQNMFIMRAIENFERIVGCRPVLVFDRGFAAPSVVRFLLVNAWVFCLRVRKKKLVLYRGKMMLIPDIPAHDAMVTIYGSKLRLVISDKQDGMAEPWYLVTNGFAPSREKVIDTYHHRFEIEEFFRDAKRLLGLEGMFFKTEQTIAVVLWFTVLGVWCLEHIASCLDDLARQAKEKMQLSEIRYAFEMLRAAVHSAAEGQYLHSYDV